MIVMWDSNDVEYLLILFFLFNPDLFCLVYRAILFFILAVFVRKLIVDYVGIIHKNRNQSCFVSLFFSCLAFNVAPPSFLLFCVVSHLFPRLIMALTSFVDVSGKL